MIVVLIYKDIETFGMCAKTKNKTALNEAMTVKINKFQLNFIKLFYFHSLKLNFFGKGLSYSPSF